jgi:autotransporter translocation and assembly factor TamB
MWRRVRRIGRMLAWIALSALLVALLAATTLILWARSSSGRRVILARGVSLVQRQLSGRLTVGALEGDLTRQIVLRRIRLYDREHQLAVAVDSVRVEYDLFGLVRRRVRVRSLAVAGARVRARPLRDGELNLATLMRTSPAPAARATAPSEPGHGRGWELLVDALRVDAEMIVEVPPLRSTLHTRVEAAGEMAWKNDAPAFDAVVRVLPAGGELRTDVHAAGRPLAWNARVQSHDLDPALLLPGVAHGRIDIAAEAEGKGRTGRVDVERLTLDAAGTHASLLGFVALDPTLTADLRAEAYSPELSRFLLPDLHGSVDAHAHLRRTASHTYVDAALEGRRLAVGTRRIDALDGDLHLEDKDDRIVARARVDAAGSHQLLAALSAHGVRRDAAVDLTIDHLAIGQGERGWRLTRPGRMRVDERALTVALALAAAEQTLTLDAAVDRGRGRPAALAGDVRGTGLRLERLKRRLPPSLRSLSGATDFAAQLSGTTRDARIAAQWDTRIGAADEGGALHGELTVGMDLVRARHQHFDELLRASPLTLTLRGHARDLPQLPGRLEVALDAQGTLRAAKASFHATARGVTVSELHGIDVTIDGTYAHRHATVTVDGAMCGQQLFAARAESRFALEQLLRGRDVPVTADASVPAFDLSCAPHLGGVVEATASVRGTLAHPTVRSALVGRDLRLAELRFSSLDAHATWDGAALAATLDGRQPSGGTLHLDASLPAAEDAPLSAVLRAESFTFAVNDVGSVHRLEGALAADLRIAGSRSHPQLGGFLRIDHGAFAGGNDPRLFRDLTLHIDVDDDAIELRRFAVHVGRGSLTARGRITLAGLTPATIEMVAEAERFPFDPGNSETWANATIELHGRKVGPKIEGKVIVSEGSAHFPALERRKQLQGTGPLEDVIYVDVPDEPARAQTPPPALHVIAHIPGPFRVDSPEMHAQLRGELEVRTTDGTLGVYGYAETTSGQVEILGREYEIERARASFDGELDPVVDVRITRVMGDTKLILTVHGTAKAPQLEMASEPPIYNPSQVLGFVVSGDPDNVRVNEPQTERQVAGAISGVIVSKIKGQLVSGLPLDVVHIDPTVGDDASRLSGARVELGKYLRRNIYVSYVHHFGATMSDVHRTNTHEVSFEYRLRRPMVLGVRYGDAGIGAIDFSWTFRY